MVFWGCFVLFYFLPNEYNLRKPNYVLMKGIKMTVNEILISYFKKQYDDI